MNTATNTRTFLFLILLSPLFFLFGCTKTEFDPVERTQGKADFSRYIAVGNSLTQGYMDEGLREDGQRNSYPALLARQMRKVQPGMDPFDQPMVQGNGSGYRHLEYIDGEMEIIAPSDPDHGAGYGESSTWSNWGNQEQNYQYSNLGIAGVRLVDCVADEESFIDPFFRNQIMSNNPFARYMEWGDPADPIEYNDHLKERNPTFFTNWLGNNDVLGYATSGGEPATILGFSVGELSDPTEFREKYDSIMTALTEDGAKGLCVTIPDVTTIPLFNTIKASGFDKDIYIETNGGEDTILATDNDMIMLSALDSIEMDTMGKADDPVISELVLDRDEVTEVRARTEILNDEIRGSANEFGIPVLDMHEFLGTMKDGITVSGVDYSAKYIEGGTFSLDGVHPNQRGYALVANEFIRKINEEYEANLPLVNPADYEGIVFP